MHIALFTFYTILLCVALTKLRFFRAAGLRPWVLVALFCLHVVVGCLHNIIAWHYYPGHGDIWRYFSESFLGRSELKAGWSVFWADNRTWAYMPHNSIEWMHMLLNIFSFDSLSINTLLFSFPVFWGNIALFRAFRARYPDAPLTSLCVILLPSCLFWTSCINTEALVFAALGFGVYYLDRCLRMGWTSGRSLACLIFLAIVAFYRPSLLFALIPALLIWVGFERPNPSPPRSIPPPDTRQQPVPQQGKDFVFTIPRVYFILTLALLVLLLLLVPSFYGPLLRVITHRQQEFQELAGDSRIPLPPLEPSWSGFGRVFPYAIRNGLFEPLPGESGQAVYRLFSIELILVWLIVFVALFSWCLGYYRSRLFETRSSQLEAFPIACLVFAFLGMLQIGYIVPFIGAIIRYRSIFLPFLLGPALFQLRHFGFFQRFDTALSRILFS